MHCVRPSASDRPLSRAEAEAMLASLPGWALVDEARAIERRFAFQNFAEAFAFAARVAEVAEREDHHPDLCVGWGYCTVRFSTHKIGGLHRNDFVMAAKVDRLFES
ncbi:MAG: 4a-hydroxytetrahydrobiopterin dehydratase [Zetaproteobacteria bacterium]|nr:MAG: 4a-hydroxytetrahydrobiopterin dehydratase [Zetaproteobacteria bacterium]